MYYYVKHKCYVAKNTSLFYEDYEGTITHDTPEKKLQQVDVKTTTKNNVQDRNIVL